MESVITEKNDSLTNPIVDLKDKVVLHCVLEKKKLRIRFLYYVDNEGKQWNNAYNPNYNCRFPKKIRKEGCKYIVPKSAVKLSTKSKPFYIISAKDVIIMNDIISLLNIIEI